VSIRIYDCPQCGAPVKFQSSVTVFAVCEHCRSMVVRRDAKVETMGVMAELLPDLSPLQLGTRGEWQGRAFELVGRLRVEWEEGSWSEWYALFSGGEAGWIAEAQGFFMISFAADPAGLPANAKAIKAGESLRLADRVWSVVDVKKGTCLAGEGELPFIAPPGQKRLGADLTGSDGAFATIEFYEEEESQLYIGSYADFSAFHFTNLRPVPGWDADVAQIRHQTDALGCPSCGAAVNLRAAGLSMSAVCGSCGSVIDTANPQWQLIQRRDEKMRKIRPILPIGARGTLHEVQWEVIGAVRRADAYAAWTEFLLFNPWHGFTWLVTYNGHWSFVRRLPELGQLEGDAIDLDGRRFQLFAKGAAKVKSVLGEFYWKVRRGEEAFLHDYIAPPEVLSKETYPGLQEVTWSRGEYLEHTTVATAFKIEKLPEPTGVYLNQPNPLGAKSGLIWRRALIFLGLLLLVQLAFTSGSVQRTIFEEDHVFTRGTEPVQVEPGSAPLPGRTITTRRFRLDGRQGPVRIGVNVESLSNQWLSFDIDLVNAQTNATFSAPLTVQYYFGDDDGPWSEGSTENSVAIPAVPPGEYFVNLDLDSDPGLERTSWKLTVKRGGLFWENFFIGLVLLLVYPIYVSFRRHAFERSRWAESDYSPYASSEDGDSSDD
jgi:hypothetical protein